MAITTVHPRKEYLILKRIGHRKINGFSLIYVAGVGAASMLLALAASAALLPAYRNVASLAYLNETTSAAENSMQYCLALMNDAAENGTSDSFPSSISVPDAVRGQASVQVAISKLDVTSLDSPLRLSPIYDSNTQGFKYDKNADALNSDYRLVHVTAKYNSYTRTIISTVGPSPFSPAPPGKQAPYFSHALFAQSNLNLSGGINVRSEGLGSSLIDSSIGSNNTVNIVGPSVIEGSVFARNPDTNKGALFASPEAKVYGDVYTPETQIQNNSPDAVPTDQVFFPDNGPDFSTYNLLGDGTPGSTIGSFKSSQTTTIAPPQAMSTTQPAQITTLSANEISIASPQPGGVSDLGNLQIGADQSVTLNPGIYTANSIDVANGGTLNINVPPTSSTGVQIYVQGSGPGNDAVNMSGSMTFAGAPPIASNVQIFYNGSKGMNFSTGLGNLFGLIYGPHSKITINTGTSGRFHGSVVGDNVTLSGSGKFLYDKNSVNPAGGGPGASGGPGYFVTPQSTKYRILSWQEK